MFLTICIIYTYIFYLAILVTSARNLSGSLLQKRVNIFFIIELIMAILYSILIYFLLISFNYSFDFTHWDEIERLIIVICFFGGYIGSVTRLMLTKKIFRYSKKVQEDLLVSIGDVLASNTTLERD